MADLVAYAKYDAAAFIDPSTQIGPQEVKAFRVGAVGMKFFPTENTTWGDWESILEAIDVFAERRDPVELDFIVEYAGDLNENLKKGKLTSS